MKITCQACQAKYTIADEKVAGKIVKIRCKKCGATIVVNSNEPAGTAGTLPAATGGAFDYAAQGTAQSQWMVNVAEGDQRTMTGAELVLAYQGGVVNDETFCWREGMADWLPIHEVGPLHAACTAKGPPIDSAREEDDLATRTQDPNMALPGVGTGASPLPGPAAARPDAKDGNGTPAGPPTTSAVAARRAGGRAAAADLFRSAAQAGGEDEVMTSAPAGRADGQKATGRNDLLFEMGGQNERAAQPPSMTATSEASGLIDIRQLGAQMRSTTEEKKKSRVEDIMNLGGGGTFSPSLAAPVLSAPSLEHYSQPPPRMLSGPAAAQAKSKALIFLAIGAGIFFLVAAVGIVVVLVRGKGMTAGEEQEKTATNANGAPTTPPGVSVATNAPPPPPAVTAETSQGTGAASAAPAEAPSARPASVVKETMAPKEPKAAPAAPAAPASAAEFNLGEARARLAAVAGAVQTCKRGDTSGAGKVEIMFAPSGAVQSATLMGGSPFDGTPTGKCVEARFRQARVPAFGGGPVPVTKSFSIN